MHGPKRRIGQEGIYEIRSIARLAGFTTDFTRLAVEGTCLGEPNPLSNPVIGQVELELEEIGIAVRLYRNVGVYAPGGGREVQCLLVFPLEPGKGWRIFEITRDHTTFVDRLACGVRRICELSRFL